MIKKALIAGFNLLFLTVSLATGVYFVRQSQDVGAAASNVTALSLESDKLMYEVGERMTVAVKVDGAKQAVGYLDTLVEYDPSMLKAVSVTAGDFMPKKQVLADAIDNVRGQVHYSASVASGTPPSVGRGTAAIIVFDVVGAGQAMVDIGSGSVTASHEGADNVLQSTSELMISAQ